MSSFKINMQTFRASGAVSKGKGVKFGSDGETVAQCSATTDKVIGIAQNDAASGELVEVAKPGGGAKALAGAAIDIGDLLGVSATGALAKVAAQHERIIAVAQVAAASGDIFGVDVVMAQATQAQS